MLSRWARFSATRFTAPLNANIRVHEMRAAEEPISLKPREFELAVKEILDAAGQGLTSFSSWHQEPVRGMDGDYVIDVTARFSALGADFLVLVECKHEKRKVERQDVQILRDKVQSTGAHKGMMFSVAGFQSGAIEYATMHGIALVQIADGSTCWFTKGAGPPTPPPPWAGIPKYVGWWYHGNNVSLMSKKDGDYTRKALGFEDQEP